MRDFWENVQLQPPSNVHAYHLPLKQFFSCATRSSDVSNTSLHFTQKISASSGSSFITFFGCFILLVSNLSGSNQVFLMFSLITANLLFTLLLLTDCLAPTLFETLVLLVTDSFCFSQTLGLVITTAGCFCFS